MDSERLRRISDGLAVIAGVVAECVRQGRPSYGGQGYSFTGSALMREGEKLRLEGLPALADGVRALRIELEGSNNG